MSVLVALRVPEDLLEKIDKAARAEEMNRSQMIIYMLRESNPAQVESVKKPSAKVESVKPQPKPPAVLSGRPAHAATCKCGMCQGKN
jgi:hypothetical protein